MLSQSTSLVMLQIISEILGSLPTNHISISYYNAIETTRNNSDHLWQAAALEGLCVALILLAYLHADIGVSFNMLRVIKCCASRFLYLTDN